MASRISRCHRLHRTTIIVIAFAPIVLGSFTEPWNTLPLSVLLYIVVPASRTVAAGAAGARRTKRLAEDAQ
jgi:hypothetical protein